MPRRCVVAALLLAGLTSCSFQQAPEQALPDGPFSDIELGWTTTTEFIAPAPVGNAVQGQAPDSIEGRTVLINFWGSWCEPCKEEMPLLQRLADETDVQVIGVSRDRFEKHAAEFLSATGATFPNVLDPDGMYMGQFSRAVPRQALPSSVLVVDGTVVAAHIGPFKKWSDLTTNRPG